ncbi:hypothetical protein KX928_04855 [Roseobacter sp. YSTF-M11]|uniref:Cyanobacterial TRADD-N associated 2 transmembrane domain-containing protein n=1 Tax=Roseobacter insulae TaxID=2859783 RepID=A0A9X1FT80_9RHOB|nr:hypothetical protein [Roseobacter insulae]MBW4707111.1 hypothetical protein [Roseobacter insulae]
MDTSTEIFQIIAAAVAVVAVAVSLLGAFRSGAIKSLRFGSIAIEGAITPEEISRIETDLESSKPFETKALSSYYNQALQRANVSFWFSLVFASVGFGVIVFAFASHSSSDLTATVVKVVSGVIIDAVSVLFFAQSTSSQKSMSEFFEKLRHDRLNAEAREMICEIEDVSKRDEVRTQLILKYSGIDVGQ